MPSRRRFRRAGQGVAAFTVLPAGNRNNDGTFNHLGNNANFWSSSENDASIAWYRYFSRYGTDMGCNNYGKSNGFSLRCIVDVFEPIPKPPNFFPPPGTYDNPIIVTLNKSGMRYTLDGTDPAETSPFLDIPLRISGPTEIRLKSDAMPTVYSFAYLIKGRALPMYKQAALWADGNTSPESITRTYHG